MAGKKIGEAFLRVRPDTAGFARDAQPGMVTAGKSVGTTFGSAFRSVLGPVAAAVGVMLAGRAVLGFASEAVAEAREALRIGNLTNAVIKSTGAVAGVTAKDVETLADRIGALAGVDDEAVQSAENLLLTFTNIRNIGKNRIFDEATQSIVDMTAAMNGGIVTEDGLKTATIQVGKALNDPIKGITALRKVGVAFTAQQVDQIKKLVASGKTMEAQKIILGELKREFGGAAAAAADPAQKASVAWNNFKETLGNFVLPVLGQLADVFTTRILPIIEGKVVPALQRFGVFLRTEVVPVIRDQVIPALQQFGRWVAAEVLPRLRTLIDYVRANVIPVLIDLVVRGFRAAQEAVAKLRQTFVEHRAELTQLWNGFKTVVDFIVTKVLPVVGPMLTNTVKGIVVVIQSVIRQIAFWVTAFNTIKGAVTSAIGFVVAKFNELVAFVRAIPGRVTAALGNVNNLLLDAGRRIIQGLLDGISAGFQKVKDLLGRLTALLPDWKGPRLRDRKLLFGAGKDIIDSLGLGMEARIPSIKDMLGDLTGTIGGPRRLAVAGAGGTPHFTFIVDGRALDPTMLRVLDRNANAVAAAAEQGRIGTSRRGLAR